ncbi:hypothetical protein IU450_28630 [Nocardia abscessus]|uniref:hypothetical protein n=1 Tax=Nocardia abscessus TaxID=120957 RepID=UPI00189458AD|nr:hypothetical protein [Nocardia abscessus]MBF6339827.1 hypothetical protein [Nocardia abscessus]
MSIENGPDLSGSTLLEHADDVFERLVLDNMHHSRRDPRVWAALTTPAVIERTYSALTTAFQRNARAMVTRRNRHQAAAAERRPGTPLTAQQRRQHGEYQY